MTVFMIVRPDRGDGFHKLDTGGVQAYSTLAAAEEDLSRFLFKAGYRILEVPVISEPTVYGTAEQRERWEARKAKGGLA